MEHTNGRVAPSSAPAEDEPIASWKVELSGGALCSLMVCVAFYPLESVEARMQVGQLAAAGSGTARRSLAGLVTSVGRSEGARGLYRGVVPTATGTVVNGGLYFALYDHLRSRLHRTFAPTPAAGTESPSAHAHPAQKRRPAMGIDLMAAAMSGVVCTLVVNPFWVLKLHRITAGASANPARPPSLLASVRHIVGTQGYRGLWKGTVISLLGVADGAIQFATYDQLKYWLSDERGELPVWAQLLAGASSRAVALTTTYPYQLLRSVLQQQNCPYPGLRDATRHIVKAEGLRGLYKGIGLNLTRSLPPAACFWFIIEQFRLALK